MQLSFLKKEEKTLTGDSSIDVHQNITCDKRLSVVSLFSGCGGMDLGFRGDFSFMGNNYYKNPFDIIFANDIVKRACNTYMHNFKHQSICEDIRDIPTEQIPKADIVIGGFPCQDFSHAGKRKGLSSERGKLYLEMKRVIEHCNPIAFIAENVDGIRTSINNTDSSALDKIVDDFAKCGYNVMYKVLNAADFGVPQTRIRVIIIGIRKDMNCPILFPKPIRGEETNYAWVTVKEAIDDLWDKIDSNEVYNHSSKDYSKAKFYPGKRMQGNCKLDENKPSITIRAEHHGNIEGHYKTKNIHDSADTKSWRRLSVRECARIQSFPDDFVFPCAASDAYKQIGNAVPPVLAWHIARAVYISLSKRQA